MLPRTGQSAFYTWSDKDYGKNTAKDLCCVGCAGGVASHRMVREVLVWICASEHIFRRRGRKPCGRRNGSDRGKQVFQGPEVGCGWQGVAGRAEYQCGWSRERKGRSPRRWGHGDNGPDPSEPHLRVWPLKTGPDLSSSASWTPTMSWVRTCVFLALIWLKTYTWKLRAAVPVFPASMLLPSGNSILSVCAGGIPSLPICVVPRGLSQPTSTFEWLALARPRRALSGTWLKLLGKSYSLFTTVIRLAVLCCLGAFLPSHVKRTKPTWRKQSQGMQRGWLLLTPFEPLDSTMPLNFLVINANKFTFLFKSACAEL